MPDAWSRVLLLALAILGSVGCRRSPTYGPLADVAGTVTVDGKPLNDGTVAFVTPATGDVQVFPVRDGQFTGRSRVGERRVEFRRYAAAKAEASGLELPGPSLFPANTLPDHLNSMSTITVTIAAEGRNEFTFDLKTAPPGAASRLGSYERTIERVVRAE